MLHAVGASKHAMKAFSFEVFIKGNTCATGKGKKQSISHYNDLDEPLDQLEYIHFLLELFHALSL